MTDQKSREYYQALLEKDTEYEGVFFVGVKTTGVFCRPTCPARKPKLQNCEFFATAEQALLASFRPCKRCQPLSHPSHVSESVQQLVEMVEQNPEKRWRERDFEALDLDASTARRQFKKRFGMTFIEYARARRMGLAMKEIRKGKPVIEAQLSTGYESSSGFRDAFSKIMGSPPSLGEEGKVLSAAWLDTKLGPMVAIADEQDLYLLEFVDRRGLEGEVERLRKKTKAAIIPGKTDPIDSIEEELDQYFKGELTCFQTPVKLLGTPFQMEVWEALCTIPFGDTWSYAELAASIGKPSGYRAVARANGANQLALMIPCHRIINSNGELGGYGGGLPRKEWLIQHEQRSGISLGV
ncbi:trifunctional transcriptional activator/DNA repair protein Ada/methylated-DNA--[protein]-cysteine S-methyltransferase [Halobacillus litoralis]|uniref:bifunctional transcriptional activator/DNA repair enzyme AdaA n=1 Tax=Halobacillus litoralis TaxID=45668 RepID=UPI001CD77C19|nr:methylated-DNA--[protein]-cysteine S-methyltransferase [Halobacillus litoralis]MCA0970489.1 trifunctional transcriptional activator/DNA repair protein Ada/methylated-DNA--[protein]-cysteine S-methyltransferase [Halobacillus litoralis]